MIHVSDIAKDAANKDLTSVSADAVDPSAADESARHPRHVGDLVTVLETALDDLSPQVLAYAAEKLLEAGALDVMLAAVVMKKGRPGTLLTVICNPADSVRMQEVIFAETTTLGIRLREDRRVSLERTHVRVETAYGSVRVKVGSLEGKEMNAAPEFEDCRVVAERCGVAVKVVMQAAVAGYAVLKGKDGEGSGRNAGE